MNTQDFHRVVASKTGGARFNFVAWVLAILLVAGCGKSPEEKKVEAAAAKAVVEAQTTGRLTVKSNRTNTTVEAVLLAAEGEASSTAVKGTAEGAAEQTLAALPPGRYAITARSAGWPDVRVEANVVAGRTAEVTIDFKSGSLRLASDPTGATVKQGAAVLGKTPLVIPQLPPGECKLFLEYPSWPALPFTTTIVENGETAETVRLPHGKLTVESTPSGATVLLGARAAGQTPLILERVPAGPKKLTLQAKNFPPMELSVTVDDRSDVKVSPQLGSGFPLLDPEALLRAVWVPDDPNRISPPIEGTIGPSKPRNDIIRNLHRKRLYEGWMRKSYRFSATVKAYDVATGQVEFAEQKSALSRYRVLAMLSTAARQDKDLTSSLTKGATFTVYGRLSAVEEPRWPSKVITFELSPAEPLR